MIIIKIKNIKEKLVKEKDESSSLYTRIKEVHGLDIEDFAFVLGDKDAFKQKFLIPHYKMYNILQEINTTINNLRQKVLSKEELQEYLSYFYKKKLELAESKLEIYFCNAMSGDRKTLKTLANIVMPFGLTHTGILVDDLCIQWGRGLLGKSLVNPSISAKYNDYIYAIELDNKEIWDLIKETFNNITDYICGRKNFENMGTLKAFYIADSQLDSIAEVCVDYNINKMYHLVFENCQHFVTKILNKLKLNVYKEGEVGRVLSIAEDKGDIIDFIYNGTKFKKRRELDEYVLQIDFNKLPIDHRRVLFCFRNVFEYYSRNRPNDDKYKTSDFAKEYWNELSNQEKFN